MREGGLHANPRPYSARYAAHETPSPLGHLGDPNDPLYGPVIDTHHHIWLRKDVAWLKDPPIRRAIGDFFNMRRDIPVEEWMHDVVPQGVVKSVHVTGNWGPDRALDETRWLQSIAIYMVFHMR